MNNMGIKNLGKKALNLSLLAALSVAIPLPAVASSLYKFTSFDYPGELETAGSDINSLGQIVGTYNDGGSAFLSDGKNFTSFKPPGASEVFIPGINNKGTVVGGYFDADNVARGFIKEGDKYTTINYLNDPSFPETALSSINNSGIAVGYYYDREYTKPTSFSLDSKKNTYTEITIPDASKGSFAWGNNDFNQIVGSYRTDTQQFGYFYDKGNFTKLEFPNSSLTAAYGINDSGKIVGSFFRPETGRDLYSFIWDKGVFKELKYPGATGTFASAIDNSGRIVGYYFDQKGDKHGFVAAKVPEPSAGLGVFAVLGVAAVTTWKKHRAKV
jgi:uncharacterized membrane protein